MTFVDSSFWIAHELSRDRHHAEARSLEKQHGRGRLVTSTAVLAETWTYLRRRAGHPLTMTWLDRVLAATDIGVDRIDDDLEAEAWAWLRVHEERPCSFVDATSFALMRRLRLTDVLAFDGDFAAAGFNELRPDAGFVPARRGYGGGMLKKKKKKKRWSELSRATRTGIVAGGLAELVVTAVALRDLVRRPAELVRGPKPLWGVGLFVQPVGSPLYLLVGRRHATETA